jgi:hypothetical protein
MPHATLCEPPSGGISRWLRTLQICTERGPIRIQKWKMGEKRIHKRVDLFRLLPEVLLSKVSHDIKLEKQTDL